MIYRFGNFLDRTQSTTIITACKDTKNSLIQQFGLLLKKPTVSITKYLIQFSICGWIFTAFLLTSGSGHPISVYDLFWSLCFTPQPNVCKQKWGFFRPPLETATVAEKEDRFPPPFFFFEI